MYFLSACLVTVAITVLRVDSPEVYQPRELRAVVGRAERDLRKIGVCIRRARIRSTPMLPALPPVPGWLPGWYSSANEPARRGITIVAIPPVEAHGGHFFAGAAEPERRIAAVVSSPLVDTFSGDPVRANAAVMSHEIAHLFGAEHVNSPPNLMDSGLAFYGGFRRVSFLSRTRAEAIMAIRALIRPPQGRS